MKPYLLGLTGGIGSGKTTTAGIFREYGVAVWSADEAVHHLYETDAAVIDAVAQILPDVIKNKQVHRPALRLALQKNPTLFADIEKILSPRLKLLRQAFIAGPKDKIKVFDIPLLYETGAESWLDGVLVVTIDEAERTWRVLARGTMDKAALDMILARQIPVGEKIARADFVIRTESLESVKREVKQLIQTLEKEKQNA